VKALLYRAIYREIKAKYIGSNVIFQNPGKMRIGKGTRIESNTLIRCIGIKGSIEISENAVLGPNASITVVECNLIIGANFSINDWSSIDSIKANTIIGSWVRCGKHVHIGAANHNWRLFASGEYPTIESTPLIGGETCIGSNVWICSYALILAGANIEHNSICPPYTKITNNNTNYIDIKSL
jgi:acetyltransferase-like isoleucine patch superfamily enzyme